MNNVIHELRRVMISLWDDKRLILYPAGGIELEKFVDGPGWVIANQEDWPDDAEIANLCELTASLAKGAQLNHEVPA